MKLPELTPEQKERCREIWDGESIGELHDFEQIMREGIAIGLKQRTEADEKAMQIIHDAARLLTPKVEWDARQAREWNSFHSFLAERERGQRVDATLAYLLHALGGLGS